MTKRRAGSSRLLAWMLAGALSACAVVAGAGSANASPSVAAQPGCSGNGCAQPGDLIDVALGDLHPTQSVLGYDEVYYKLGRYRSNSDELAGDANKRFDDWCETNGQGVAATVAPDSRLDHPASFTCTIPIGAETAESKAEMKTVVIGPGGALYLTDGHHTLTSFLESPDGGARMHIRLRVTGNLATLSTAAFWQQMQANRWVWLRDENNRPITVDQLPARLGLANFHDDPYRGLVYFTRDIGYAVPADAPEYLEFYWGSWLRKSFDLSSVDLTDPAAYLDVVRQTSQAMAALKDTDVVEAGTTAGQLGKMAQWNDGKKVTGGEFGKLSKPISDPKPGKLAFALDFRASVAKTPACTTTITGTSTKPLTVNSGVLCFDRAHQTGPVTVGSGVTLVAYGSTLTGPVRATGAAAVRLCGDTVNGPVTITGTTGTVALGGTGCTVNAITGPVTITGDKGGVALVGNDVTGPLSCSGNQPAPENAGRPNRVTGPRTGQCADL